MVVDRRVCEHQKQPVAQLRLLGSASTQVNDSWRRRSSISVDQIGKVAILGDEHAVLSYGQAEQVGIRPVGVRIDCAENIMPLTDQRMPNARRNVNVEHKPQAF